MTSTATDYTRERNRTADTAADAMSRLKSELDNYAGAFTGEERRALVASIQSLEKLLRIIG